MSKTSTKPAPPLGETRNKVGIARLFGTSTKVVERWISEGLPVVSAPSTRNGEYRISTQAAWQWHMERMAASDGEPSLDAERARLTKEQADGHELKNATLRAELLPADEAAVAW